MISISRTRAENHFAAIEKRQQAALSVHEEAALAARQKTARLKALRLARDSGELADISAKKSGAKVPATKRLQD